MAVAELALEDIPIDIDPNDVPKGYELIDGELMEKRNMGAEASWVATLVHNKLTRFLDTHPIGVSVTSEFSYQCFPDRPRLVRKPDVSIILCDPTTFVAPRVNYLNAPALVIEALSPANTMGDMFDRFSDYFSAGTKLIWLIDPERRFAQVYHQNFSSVKVAEAECLSGEDVLPGFTLPLAEILPKKAS